MKNILQLSAQTNRTERIFPTPALLQTRATPVVVTATIIQRPNSLKFSTVENRKAGRQRPKHPLTAIPQSVPNPAPVSFCDNFGPFRTEVGGMF